MKTTPDLVVQLDLAAERHACPQCGERRIDFLVWIDDEQVKCETCGQTYEP